MSEANSAVMQPVVRKQKWPHALIWILPLIVLGVAALYLKDYLTLRGEEISIEFSEADGLREGETKLLHRGAEIGVVTSIELSENHKHAIVHARLQKRDDVFATKGATYWIVRPEVSQSGLSGLGTLFSGPYINALPGKDEQAEDSFKGMTHAPRAYEEGVRLTLNTPRLGHVQDGSAVYYKGIQVGSVQEVELANDADHLEVHIVVWTRFAPLVRENSKFWVASGIDFKGGIFSGIEMKVDSLKTIVSGGVSFATPDATLKPARNGNQFVLEAEAKKEWLEWAPRISLSGKASDAPAKPVAVAKVAAVNADAGGKPNSAKIVAAKVIVAEKGGEKATSSNNVGVSKKPTVAPKVAAPAKPATEKSDKK